MINRSSIFHRSINNYCYAINNESIRVSLLTGTDVTKVEIEHGDPYLGGIMGGNYRWLGKVIEIQKCIELQNSLLWVIDLTLEYKRGRYNFIIHGKNEKIIFCDEGIFEYDEYINLNYQPIGFIFPWLNENDIFKTPNWVKNTVWYQIFPDRFHTDNQLLDWHSGEVTNKEVYGGNLVGIIEKLEYLKKLGISGIYLTPIFEASSVHKYDTINYFKIDPSFGTNEQFKELVKKAHSLGIKIMIDCVFNHVGKFFNAWQDVVKNGQNSKYKDWFFVNKWPVNPNIAGTKGKEFMSFAFSENMPKLNTNNIEVQEYLVSVCEYWIKECDIDGIRIDVANETSHDFNKYLRKSVKAIKPDIYILGEIWHDASMWLLGDEFDSVMNYPLLNAFKNFWDNKESEVQLLYKNLNRIFNMYHLAASETLFNLLDSHDTDRLYRRYKNSDIILQQLALLFFLPGSPCIYYGTEILLDGAHDPDCRRLMQWDSIVDDKICEIIKLNSLMDNSDFSCATVNKRVIVIIRSGYKIIINCSELDYYYEEKNIIVGNNYENKKIHPNGFVVVKNV